MGINKYLTLYRCIRNNFKYQYQIACNGYQNIIRGDRKDTISQSYSEISGIEIKNDATSKIIVMSIYCN